MPGIGAALLIVAYGIGYAAAKQMVGTGGSVLYWLTGNARFGAPPPTTKQAGGGSKTPPGGAGNAPTKKHPGTPVPAPRR